MASSSDFTQLTPVTHLVKEVVLGWVVDTRRFPFDSITHRQCFMGRQAPMCLGSTWTLAKDQVLPPPPLLSHHTSLLLFFEGWFYEGGGIYRKTYLHSAPTVHIDTDGLVVRSNVTSLVNARGPSALGATAAATVSVKADLVNMNTASQASASVRFEVIDSEGSVVGFAESQTVTIAPAPDKSKPSTRPSEWVTMSLAKSELWSVGRPYIYTLRATVNSGDSWNTTFGIHSTRWTGDKGFFLNDEHVKVRGFCDHRYVCFFSDPQKTTQSIR